MLGSTSTPPLYTISTTIELPASTEQSWKVLTDFPSYTQWNPYLTSVRGVLAEGETVSVTLVDDNFAESLVVSATLGAITENTQLYWQGRVGIQGVFDTRHVFELRALDTNRTELLHYEEFRGVLAWLLPRRAERTHNTRRAFEKMNVALQQHLTVRGQQQATTAGKGAE